jgi:hypothetical protein
VTKKAPTTEGAAPATRKVMFDLPGVRAIGHYKPKTEYTVPAAEAQRLVETKGFTYCDAGPAGQEN